MNGDVLFQNVQSRLSMAAGSEPQQIESSVVPVCGKPTSNALTRIPGVRSLIPYSDHNYGKPLTPPDSCSPDHPEEADTGNEDEGFTRCICDFKHDDGYMICCDRCSAWQHVECVGIKSNSVPDTYLCDVCDPRPLDKKRAIQIQTKKMEEITDGEDDDDVSDHDSDSTISRIANSAAVVAAMKENVLTKAGKRKKRESTRKLSQKEMKHNKRKRRKRKHVSSGAIPVDEETNGPWNISSFPEHKHYEEAKQTVYVGELGNRTFPVLESSVNLNNFLKPEQICKVVDVQKNIKGVVVTEDINGQQFIIECKGNLMLESKFKEDHPMFSKSDPFVLYYTKLELVMNFAAFGNDARFVRRSCSPTAEVRHVTIDNKPHLVIVSLTPLAKGTEVTLGFEFPFPDYRRQLDCACAQENCKVLKHNMAIHQVEQTNGYRSSKDEQGLVDSSLSNHMDSDSEGENGNVKDKRSRKKLSREDRKLQQYLRQFEKMEKTEKKKQQSNGRDARAGILTQRNYPDEYNGNGETPSKPSKAIRKQAQSQRQQRKIQAIRRAHRLPSCSSEPLSPEDNYSSAASTPTTPSVNVTEESIELLHHDTPEKSFKFPKKGSMNDITSSGIDAPRSNNPSPESTAYPSPSKASFETRLVEIDEPSCDRLNSLQASINGAVSPRTDCSPSSCHSTYASPTHSENVDLPDMFSRHHLASPTGSSVTSYILNSGLYRSTPTHTTLKKRWLKQYATEQALDKPANGEITTNSFRPRNLITRVVVSPRTFPLPFKRRKLMEYQKVVNNSKTSMPTAEQTGTAKDEAGSSATIGSTIKTPSSISPPMTSCVTSFGMTSSSTLLTSLNNETSSSITSSRDMMSSYNVATSNAMTSYSSGHVRPSMLGSMRNTISGNITGSNDVGYPQVTGSEEATWRRRISGGSDDVSVGRSSLSSISSTDDVKIDTVNSVKEELNLGSAVGSTSEVVHEVPVSVATFSQQSMHENSLESSTDPNSVVEDTSKDKTELVGSSGVVEGAASTTSTTPGGKKKVSLSDYLKRKKGKKELAPVLPSDVTSATQSRASDAGSTLPNNDSVSHSGSLGTSVGTKEYGRTVLSSGVSSSTSGVMIEPVSPDEEYRGDDGGSSLLHSTGQGLQNSLGVEREAKPSVVPASSEPSSSSDAMDIDEDDAPSASKILVNTPVLSIPGSRSASVTSSDMITSLPGTSYSNLVQPIKFDNVSSAQPQMGRQAGNSMVAPGNLAGEAVQVSQVFGAQPVARHPDFRSTCSRPSPFY